MFILLTHVTQDEASSGACTALVPVTRPVMVTSGEWPIRGRYNDPSEAGIVTTDHHRPQSHGD